MVAELFLKPFLIEMIHKMKQMNVDIQSINVEEFVKSIPLSRKTITRRVNLIADDLHEQTVEDIRNSPIGHSFQSDSSRDIESKEQLVAFAR